MLVLSRKIGESIHIGNGIIITVNRLMGTRVSLGIQAPSDVTIRRGELGELTRSAGVRDELDQPQTRDHSAPVPLAVHPLEVDGNGRLRIDSSREIASVASLACASSAAELNRPQPSERQEPRRPGTRPLERTGHVKRALVRGRRPVVAR